MILRNVLSQFFIVKFINITGYSHAYQEVNNEEQADARKLRHEVQPLTVL